MAQFLPPLFSSPLVRIRYVCFAMLVGTLLSLQHVQAQTNVYFEIKNKSVVGGTHYHFDIFIYADQAGTYHSRGQVYVAYDTASLGEAIVFNGKVSNCPTGSTSNPTCSTIHLDLLDDIVTLGPGFTTPKYNTTLNDNGDRLVATWISNFAFTCPPSPGTHTEMPIISTGLYHFEIEMKNPAINPKLDFYYALMDSQQFFSNPNPPLPGQDCDQVYSGVADPLAADLLAFDAAVKENNHIALNWISLRERNLMQYVVEKRLGEEGEFEPIAWVRANGDEDAGFSYDYTDTRLVYQNTFYRLRMITADGEESYSNQIKVDVSTYHPFSIYPNPAKHKLVIIPLWEFSTTAMTYEILNAQGQIVQRGSWEATSNHEIQVAALASGIYYIRIFDNDLISFQQEFAVMH